MTLSRTSAVLAFGLAACADAPEHDPPQPESELTVRRIDEVQVRFLEGVSMDPGGTSLHLAMAGRTCRYDVGRGFNPDVDIVEDASDGVVDSDHHSVLLRTPDGVGVVDLDEPLSPPPGGAYDPTHGYGETEHVPIPGVVDGRLSERGPVVLHGDGVCHVTWLDAEVSVWLPPVACTPDAHLDVDPTTGTAWVASGRVWQVTPDGSVELGRGTAVAGSDALGVTLIADGPGTVRAVDGVGDTVWVQTFGDDLVNVVDVVDVVAIEARSAFGVLTSSGGFATVRLLDAFTGRLRGGLEVNAYHPGDLEVSEDGRVMALAADGPLVLLVVE